MKHDPIMSTGPARAFVLFRSAEVRLEENFRSTGHILAAANAVIAGDRNRLGKTLFTSLGVGHPIPIEPFGTPRARPRASRARFTPDAPTAPPGPTWRSSIARTRSRGPSKGR